MVGMIEIGRGEWPAGGQGSHFRPGSHESVDAVTEGFFQVGLDLFFQFRRVRNPAGENNISARDEGLHSSELELLKKCAQPVHFEAAITQVHATKEGNVVGKGRHLEKENKQTMAVDNSNVPGWDVECMTSRGDCHWRRRMGWLALGIALKVRVASFPTAV